MTDAYCRTCGFKGRLKVVDLRSDPTCPACEVGKLEPGELGAEQRSSLDRQEFSHRLRTPLTVVKGSLQHLIKHWDALADRDRKVLVKAVLDQADVVVDAVADMEDRLSADEPRDTEMAVEDSAHA